MASRPLNDGNECHVSVRTLNIEVTMFYFGTATTVPSIEFVHKNITVYISIAYKGI